MANKEYDFNTPVEKTSTELAKQIIEKFAEAKDFLLIENFEKSDPITKSAFIEKSTDFSIDIMKMIGASDIPFPYATRAMDKITQVLTSLQKYIEGTIEQTRHELASRTLGVKSPANDKYTEEMATVGDLLLKLDEVRVSQGNDMNDYFTMKEETKTSDNDKEVDVGVATAKYKVVGTITPCDTDGAPLTPLEIGSIQEVPIELGDGWVSQGLAEKEIVA